MPNTLNLSDTSQPKVIDLIELYRVRMPLITPWKTAYGSDAAVETVLVRMVSGGVAGWGESCPLGTPAYSPEYAAGVFNVARDFMAPRVLGKTIASGQDLQDHLCCFKGNRFAKAALDVAWWDLRAKRENQPLWRLLGGTNQTIEVGTAFGVTEEPDALINSVRNAVNAGFKRVKLKYCPGWDLPIVEAVRKAFPDLIVHIDCNCGYTLADLSMFKQLDRFGLAMIEQPLGYGDLADHAELQRCISTPICLDESIACADHARQAIQLGACRWINIKPGRVGGVTEALKIHDLCQQAELPCWMGSMLESGVGTSVLVALGTLPNMKYPGDIVPGDKFYKQDLADPPIRLSGPAQITAPSSPGIACAPDPQRLRSMTIEHVVLES